MSKKCCGIVYSDDEKVCKVCGKPLDSQKDSEIDESKINEEESEYDEAVDENESDEDTDEAESERDEDAAEAESDEDADKAEPEHDEDAAEVESDEDLDESKAEDDTSEYASQEENKVDYLKKHIEREAILDQIFDDNGYKKNDVIKDGRGRVPYKGAGIFTLILAIIGIALIGAMVYFIILNPYYIKSGEADKKLEYPELVSDTELYELSSPLEPYSTVTDAIPEEDE